MKIRFFRDTGTALIEFTTHTVVETKEINENIYRSGYGWKSSSHND